MSYVKKEFYKDIHNREKLSKSLTGRVFSDSHRKNISISASNRQRQPMSEHTKEKLRLKRQGFKMPIDAVLKIADQHKFIFINMETGIFYFGYEKAAWCNNIGLNSLRDQIRGKLKRKCSVFKIGKNDSK